MESLRRPNTLAAVAGAVLVLNVFVLVADDSVAVDDTRAAPISTDDATAGTGDQEEASEDASEAAGADDGPDGAGADDGDGAVGGGDPTSGGGGDTGDAATDEDGGSGDADAAQDQDAGLRGPLAGTYGYSSSGSWSLRGGGEPEQYQLPATATATVEVDGDDWRLRLAAGERYADRFGFVLGADGGLDWSRWVLEREFSSGASETDYACSGDSAHYRPDEQGRVVAHDCESPAGIRSDGQVEHIGSEDVTLGDGTVVSADRLLYTYTVAGSGEGFEVTGEGRFDLWLDPATGLRVRELRSISTTTTFSAGGESVYQEDVDFLLQALEPS